MKRTNHGTIIQLQNFSLNDGDGIRTTIFMMGCPLQCRWCSNPETWSTEPQQALFNETSKRCPACQFITQEMKLNSCPHCHTKLEKQLTRTEKHLGYSTTTAELIKKIKRQKLFYFHSGGGVTFSGGEPTYQQAFFRDLVYSLYDSGVDLTLETCGYFDYEETVDCLEKFSHIFFDLKIMDEKSHLFYTGISNKLILKNLIKIKQTNIPITIRIPFIDNVNSSEKNLQLLSNILKKHFSDYPLTIELLPYHDLGKDKYEALSLPVYPFNTPTQTTVEDAKRFLEKQGFKIIEYR